MTVSDHDECRCKGSIPPEAGRLCPSCRAKPAVYPDPPVFCPSCGQGMRFHPWDAPGTALRWRCENCQWTWTLRDIIEAQP